MTDYIVRAYRGDRNWYRRIADYAKVVAEQPGQPPAFERAKDLRRELSERASRNGWTRITVEPNAPRKDTAMTDPTPTPPSGDAADSQQAEGEVAGGEVAPAAHARAMQIARDGTDTPDLDAFRVAVTRGERWPLDRLTDDMLDAAFELIERQAKEIHGFIERGNPETWELQSGENMRLIMELQHAEQAATAARDETSDVRITLDQRDATILRAAELAKRWKQTPGKQDAAKSLLAALGIKEKK